MKRAMPVLAKKYAEKFAANWKAQNPEEQDMPGSVMSMPGLALDDSLTSLQWLHNMNVLDLTSTVKLSQEGTSGSSCCSESDENSDCENNRTYSDTVESKEPAIDYKNDPSRKPSYSYATLICMAMRETKKTKITLSAIYKWIKENFMYYRVADPSWQNSIRHNLSLNKCFIKVPRRKDEPGKGGFWKIDPAYADMFVDGVFKRRRGVQTQKSSKNTSVKSKTSGKIVNKQNHRTQPYDTTREEKESKPSSSYIRPKRVKPGRLTLNGAIKIEPVDPDDITEEELPPFSGELKGDFSWNSVLPEEDIDMTIKELATAHGIQIDSPPFFNTNFTSGLHTPVCLSPPPSSDGGNDDHLAVDLDLTIRGVGLLPPPDWVPPSPRMFTEGIHESFDDMPPSPPFRGEDHPWAETDTLSYSCLDDLFNMEQAHK